VGAFPEAKGDPAGGVSGKGLAARSTDGECQHEMTEPLALHGGKIGPVRSQRKAPAHSLRTGRVANLQDASPDLPLTSLLLLRRAEVFAPGRCGTQDLLIAGGRIVAMAASLPELPAALQTTEVDLAGQRVIPGLIDGHVHLTGGGGEAGPHTRVPPLQLTALTAGGITSAVGVLGTDDAVRTTAELVVVARGLRRLGFGAWCHTGGYHVPLTTLTGTVRGDITLVDEIIGVGELAISDHRSSQPTLDELLRIASEAHVGGLMSGKAGIVHLHVGDGTRGLDLVRQALDTSEVPARVFNPTHVNRRKALFDEATALTARGVTVDITAFPVADGEDAWSAEDALERYWNAGLPGERVTVSSDGGGCLPRFDHEGRVSGMDVGAPGALMSTVLRLLHRGHALEKVLPAFTSNVASLLRLERKGQLFVGGDADLVVLGDDHAVRHVMVGGSWHRFDGRPRIQGPFESEAA
jgi:beta-aspartyl-dipeptidase (metallo-type)